MILVKPSWQILTLLDKAKGLEVLKQIEYAGRTCYKSEDKITDGSATEFVRKIIKRGHLSVIEHESISVRFVVDRGVSHELVRHRLASYSQESTRYCDYAGQVTFVIPPWETEVLPGEFVTCFFQGKPEYGPYPGAASEQWMASIAYCELMYKRMREGGYTPQQARSVLPNSLKTEVVMTANLREWRHVFELRCSGAAHPQMREVMIPLRDELRMLVPVVFD